jgi:hypothetical protein
MLGNFCWRLTDRKQRVNKKNSEIDSAASSGGQGKYMNYVSFPWLPLETALSIFNPTFLLKNSFLANELIGRKATAISDES